MWTGFYAGLNLGGGWSNSINAYSVAPYASARGAIYYLPSNDGNSGVGGFVGGGQIGYNYQFSPKFMAGVETDLQGTTIGSVGSGNAVIYPDPVIPGSYLIPLLPAGSLGGAVTWFGTVRGRAGFLFTPTLMIYGTAGFAYGGVSAGPSNYSDTRAGWTAGGGVEWMVTPSWSVKGEYLYTDLSSGGSTSPFGFQADINTVRTGVNYHFNWGSSAPAVSPY